MYRRNLVLIGICFALAILTSGCGSSTPPSPLQITTQSPVPSARVNTPYTTNLTASGGIPPYSWSASTLPPGLVLSPAGILSGTPSCCIGGTSSFTAAVSDSAHPPGSASGSFSIAVAAPLLITTTSLSNGAVGLPYGSTLAATGGFAPYTWSINQGALPSGLTLNAMTGLISGSPTGSGTSTFTVQVSDGGTPAATANANLSIAIHLPPARGAALYLTDGTAYQIMSDGSLTLLSSSPEQQPPATSSPTMPLLFTYAEVFPPPTNSYPLMVESLLVNPDYSLSLYSSSAVLPSTSTNSYGVPSVDPTGTNLYVPGYIDNGQTTGVLIYPANGSFESQSSIAVPNINVNVGMVFSPDGTLAMVATILNTAGSILSYSRSSDGTLTLAATYNVSAGTPGALTVSPDGKYLAVSEYNNNSPGIMQVFSIATDGTLTPATQPFTVSYDPQGTLVGISGMTWDSSGSFLLVATDIRCHIFNDCGGVAVLSFSGTSLSETVYPTGPAVGSIQRYGSFIYAHAVCRGNVCPQVYGYDFQNSQLTALPGSPWTSISGGPSGILIY